jgi:hypothetical protein
MKKLAHLNAEFIKKIARKLIISGGYEVRLKWAYRQLFAYSTTPKDLARTYGAHIVNQIQDRRINPAKPSTPFSKERYDKAQKDQERATRSKQVLDRARKGNPPLPYTGKGKKIRDLGLAF